MPIPHRYSCVFTRTILNFAVISSLVITVLFVSYGTIKLFMVPRKYLDDFRRMY
jgi:hypothetical protein